MRNTPDSSEMTDTGFRYESMGSTPGSSLLQSRDNMSPAEILKSVGHKVGEMLESGRDSVRNFVASIMDVRQPQMQPIPLRAQEQPVYDRQRKMSPPFG